MRWPISGCKDGFNCRYQLDHQANQWGLPQEPGGGGGGGRSGSPVQAERMSHHTLRFRRTAKVLAVPAECKLQCYRNLRVHHSDSCCRQGGMPETEASGHQIMQTDGMHRSQASVTLARNIPIVEEPQRRAASAERRPPSMPPAENQKAHNNNVQSSTWKPVHRPLGWCHLSRTGVARQSRHPSTCHWNRHQPCCRSMSRLGGWRFHTALLILEASFEDCCRAGASPGWPS